jgi:hypothetical protein
LPTKPEDEKIVTKPVDEHRVTKISKKRSVTTSEDDNIPQSEHELRVNHIDYYRVPSTSDTHRVNLVTNPVISHERGKDREVFMTSVEIIIYLYPNRPFA